MEVETKQDETPAEKVARLKAELEAAEVEAKREANGGFAKGDKVWVEAEYSRVDNDGDYVVRTRLGGGGAYLAFVKPQNVHPHSALVPAAEVDALLARVRELEGELDYQCSGDDEAEDILWSVRDGVEECTRCAHYANDIQKAWRIIRERLEAITQPTPPLPDEEFERELERLVRDVDNIAFSRGENFAKHGIHSATYTNDCFESVRCVKTLKDYVRAHRRPAPLTEQTAANFLTEANKDRPQTVRYSHAGKEVAVYSPDGSGMSIDARESAPTQPVAVTVAGKGVKERIREAAYSAATCGFGNSPQIEAALSEVRELPEASKGVKLDGMRGLEGVNVSCDGVEIVITPAEALQVAANAIKAAALLERGKEGNRD